MTIDKDHNPIKAALMVKRDNGEEVSAEAVEIENNLLSILKMN
mgnify:FL=1